MKTHFPVALILIFSCTLTACNISPERPATNDETSVWAVDLVRTLPGQQGNYLASIEANWASARTIAIGRGIVISYQAFVTTQDSSRGWDVILMTEYADSAAWSSREPAFQSIFESEEFTFTPGPVSSSEMRIFDAGNIRMSKFSGN